ncbi:hypothetical protein KC19_7G023800 [Ceratodon purpureus]|uniref:Uncharacterized protein n=1 Tax=Ceratodon purpureus TaxID=3225 RepID=A0A8T0H1E2_CERPU|nr:hypothetical protein KC19_7G023800 [Ceratodon purpureus]
MLVFGDVLLMLCDFDRVGMQWRVKLGEKATSWDGVILVCHFGSGSGADPGCWESGEWASSAAAMGLRGVRAGASVFRWGVWWWWRSVAGLWWLLCEWFRWAASGVIPLVATLLLASLSRSVWV